MGSSRAWESRSSEVPWNRRNPVRSLFPGLSRGAHGASAARKKIDVINQSPTTRHFTCLRHSAINAIDGEQVRE